jgi:hypothetical protein
MQLHWKVAQNALLGDDAGALHLAVIEDAGHHLTVKLRRLFIRRGLRNWVAKPTNFSGAPRMNVHQNARLTRHGRVLMIKRIESG